MLNYKLYAIFIWVANVVSVWVSKIIFDKLFKKYYYKLLNFATLFTSINKKLNEKNFKFVFFKT